VGVPVDEARRRLQAQRDSVAATDRIRETYGARFVGIAIEHQPDYRIIVLLTGDAPIAAETINAGGMNVPIVFRTGALATEAQLLSALKQHQATIRSLLPATQGIAIDPKTGELVVIVNAAGAAATAAVGRDAELETLTGVPVRVRALAGEARDFDVRGGSRMEANDQNGARFYCTTGFSVRESSGRTGVVTAAHCPEISGTYYNPNMTQIPLSFVNQWGYGSQDVQVHVSSYVERPEFYVNTAKTSVRRPVGQYARLATRAATVPAIAERPREQVALS